ncbi:MAG: hypothetical protein R2699_19555 [Acidimicrobiales bacterium]
MSDAPDADAPDAEDDVAGARRGAEDGDAAPALVLADPSTGRGIVVTSWACTGRSPSPAPSRSKVGVAVGRPGGDRPRRPGFRRLRGGVP